LSTEQSNETRYTAGVETVTAVSNDGIADLPHASATYRAVVRRE
jgi:hypothetical protein